MIARHSPISFRRPRWLWLEQPTAKAVSVARVNNLLEGTYKGRVYAINPRRTELFGRRCYASIGAVPEGVDLVVIVTPAPTVPGVVAECEKANAKAWLQRAWR